VSVATIAGGVLVFAARLFEELMRASGESQAVAERMWQDSVVTVVVVAVVIASVLSLVLGAFLACRVSRPLKRLGDAAHRLAGGDYTTRVSRLGPLELDALGESFNLMASALQAQEEQRAELVANFAHELGLQVEVGGHSLTALAVDKSRDRARGGAGIGLAIVKQLIEQAGGRVGAESALGTTRFWFRLPAS
jgi:two-component system sensor histidine kinase BaeS